MSAESSSSNSVPQSKILEIFPMKEVGKDMNGKSIYKRACWICGAEFTELTQTSSLGRHLKRHCPGKKSSSTEDEVEFLFQTLLSHPRLDTADLMVLKGQGYFDDNENYQHFLEELKGLSIAKGLQTPGKKVGRTPKQKPSAGKSFRNRKGNKRTLDLGSEEQNQVEQDGAQEDEGENNSVVPIPAQTQEVLDAVSEAVEQFRSNFQETMESMQNTVNGLQTQIQEILEVNRELLIINRQLIAQQAPNKEVATQTEDTGGNNKDAKHD